MSVEQLANVYNSKMKRKTIQAVDKSICFGRENMMRPASLLLTYTSKVI